MPKSERNYKKKEEIFKKVPSYSGQNEEIKSLDESIQRKKGDSYSDLSLNQNEYVHIKRPSAPNKTINNDISNKDSDDDGGGCYVF